MGVESKGDGKMLHWKWPLKETGTYEVFVRIRTMENAADMPIPIFPTTGKGVVHGVQNSC